MYFCKLNIQNFKSPLSAYEPSVLPGLYIRDGTHRAFTHSPEYKSLNKTPQMSSSVFFFFAPLPPFSVCSFYGGSSVSPSWRTVSKMKETSWKWKWPPKTRLLLDSTADCPNSGLGIIVSTVITLNS